MPNAKDEFSPAAAESNLATGLTTIETVNGHSSPEEMRLRGSSATPTIEGQPRISTLSHAKRQSPQDSKPPFAGMSKETHLCLKPCVSAMKIAEAVNMASGEKEERMIGHSSRGANNNQPHDSLTWKRSSLETFENSLKPNRASSAFWDCVVNTSSPERKDSHYGPESSFLHLLHLRSERESSKNRHYSADNACSPRDDVDSPRGFDTPWARSSSDQQPLRHDNDNIPPPRLIYNSLRSSSREDNLDHRIDDDANQDKNPSVNNKNGFRVPSNSGPKRRKRICSTRSKTGCLTCRRRKKKCDEQHPECKNCNRGGFVCEGYSLRNFCPKPREAPNPIQPNVGASNLQFQQTQYLEDPEYRKQDLSIDKGLRYGHALGWQPQPAHYSQCQPQAPIPWTVPNYENLTGSSEFWPAPAAHYSGGAADISLTQQQQHGHPPSLSLLPSSSHYRVRLMQEAGSIPHSSSGSHVAQPPSPVSRRSPLRSEIIEREKMLRGEYYLPYTAALVEDREQCALAVWIFNNKAQCKPPEERMNFFRQIMHLRPAMEPGHSGELSGFADPRSSLLGFIGSVGTGVEVEVPFHCDYGYNISIGDNVVIGAGCRIKDTCSVRIGSNVVFSPGVTLVCTTYPVGPHERRKGKGRALGRSIIVNDDVWIGPNVTILPGVNIGKCSTVGAGSLLHKTSNLFPITLWLLVAIKAAIENRSGTNAEFKIYVKNKAKNAVLLCVNSYIVALQKVASKNPKFKAILDSQIMVDMAVTEATSTENELEMSSDGSEDGGDSNGNSTQCSRY